MKYKNDLVLTEDEKLSPSFENAIILWTLEKIDPRLPHKVKRDYGYQMTGNTTLKDIQPVIFENISTMIEDLDQSQATKSLASQVIDETPCLNAIGNGRNFRGKTRPFTFKSRGFNRGNSQTGNSSAKRPFTNKSQGKYCRICHLAGSDMSIYTSHEIGNCSRLSFKDLESLKNALVLNNMFVVEEQPLEEPTCVLQPGWDDVEESDLQHHSDQE